jgi:putative chitinase
MSKDITMNLTTFFAYARRAPFGGRLTQAQIDGMKSILTEWDKRQLLDNRWLAYMLATAFHETGAKMQPIREMGGEKYLKSKPYYPWVGEGLVQVTWEANHRKFGATKPGQLLTMPIAIKALFDGMIKGMFSGRKLSDYFNAMTNDAEGARKIVNGTDKKALIAGYHMNFMDAIEASREILPPLDVTRADARPDDKPASQSGTAITTVLVPAATGLAVPIVTGINNVYALIFAVALLAVSCIAGFMFISGRWSVNRSKAV